LKTRRKTTPTRSSTSITSPEPSSVKHIPTSLSAFQEEEETTLSI
jgi:hypothetical protein